MNNTGITDDNHEQNNYAMYKKYYEACQEKSDKLTLVSGKVSLLRGFTFAAAGLFLFIGFQQKNPALLAPALGLTVVFFMLIHYHSRLKEEQAGLKDSQSVLKEYMARFDDGWKSFPVDGTRYLKDDFSEAWDLDLPGKGFAADSALQICAGIKSRQQAVAELAGKTEFCMKLETGARCLRNTEYDESRKMTDDFFRALETGNSFPAVCRILIRMFPLLTLAFLFSALLGVHRNVTAPLFTLFAFAQLLSVFLGFYWNNQALSPVFRMNRTITPYRKLFQLLERESFDSSCLNDLQKTLLKNGTASAALRELEAIADSVCTRHNIYAFLLCNSLFLYDYHCMERYGKWKDKYRDSLKPWLKALGTAEALISLSVISRTRKFHCLPEIMDFGYPVLTASDIRHPLLKESAVVGNDIDLTHRTCIITGSNMSGKTTFMRSIGINLVLAYAGGFCTASNLQVSLMELCTSIRIEDNVNEGISTFYAELLRIRQIMNVSKKQVPMISLIDEIYKGTNSKDRIFAAKETIRNLSKPFAFTLVTTHDFELCDLENDLGMDAKNYFFTEHYKENRILFDYKLREGRCTTTNARYLLRMAGIIK